MATLFRINAQHIADLDLSPVAVQLQSWSDEDFRVSHSDFQFEIDYPQVAEDGFELPEIPEIRLWFIRLDSVYPWLPYFLDRSSGELVRYAAMLIPNEFSPKEGIQFNPQALDIFIMQKIFVISSWMQDKNITGEGKLRQMVEYFGYELDAALFELL